MQQNSLFCLALLFFLFLFVRIVEDGERVVPPYGRVQMVHPLIDLPRRCAESSRASWSRRTRALAERGAASSPAELARGVPTCRENPAALILARSHDAERAMQLMQQAWCTCADTRRSASGARATRRTSQRTSMHSAIASSTHWWRDLLVLEQSRRCRRSPRWARYKSVNLIPRARPWSRRVARYR